MPHSCLSNVPRPAYARLNQETADLFIAKTSRSSAGCCDHSVLLHLARAVLGLYHVRNQTWLGSFVVCLHFRRREELWKPVSGSVALVITILYRHQPPG